MRWDALFGDMEAQLAAGRYLGLESETSERTRVDQAGVDLVDRLRGALGTNLTVDLGSGVKVRGILGHAGSEWLVLNDGPHQWLIPYWSVASLQGLGRVAVAERSEVRKALGLASAIRGLARDRQELTVHLMGSQPGMRHGVVDRVGRDFFDLAITVPGESRRRHDVSAVVTVPIRAVEAIRAHRFGD
ncbi:hypothetical protein [Arthrobacter sp. M4]|uniref:hypothetical protein n=1 Tax=Arthrobacter sp. M4 TaxID=218160 RepID=UPI001CDBF4AA|nr:hypothetical protein [Arthrobacter sp. M4]MCA4132275.1 hypothetical protein [Arthrobacter sp. M4]